jgi:hypothetical protein
MKSRIARISVHQTSKTLAFIYGLLALLITPFMVIFSLSEPVDESVPAVVWLFFPLIYAALAYPGFAILFLIYNFVAKRAGGIEMEMAPVESPTTI